VAEQIRTFVAVELGEHLLRALAELEADLKRERASGQIRWVAPDNIHLTAKFLGNVDVVRLPELQRAIADACSNISRFSLTVAGAGAFPNTRRPNVIWVGLAGQVDMAAMLVSNIEDECAAIGFPRESRPFSPHLTLGRVRREASPSDRRTVGEMIEKAQVGELGAVLVDHVAIMKSELRPTGSIYTRLATIEFKPNPG
jgi:2'-5' RNA ligase